MKVYVIYDETGSVHAVRYGEDQSAPEEIKGKVFDLPEGALITNVDVSDSENHKVVFNPPKESALEKEVKELRAQVAYLTMMSGVEMEGEINE